MVDKIEAIKITQQRTDKRVEGELAEIAEANRVPQFEQTTGEVYEYTTLSPMEIF